MTNPTQLIEQLASLLKRYRTETPLGHQPYLSAETVDGVLSEAQAHLEQPTEPAPSTAGERATCGICGYTGSKTDSVGQCPKCHWDELKPCGDAALRSALNAMLTQFGMDEDEWNKPTFDQARAALLQSTALPASGLPDCWVVVKDGAIIGTHDEPGHLHGIDAVRYVPAALPAGVLTDEQLPPVPSAYVNGVYMGYGKSDLRDYARAALSAARPQPVREPLTDERIRLDEGEWPIIALGQGLVEVAEGWQGETHALIFGRNGSGVIGSPTQPDRSHLPGETLAVVTFENVESLDVVAGKLQVLREKIVAHGITQGGKVCP